MSTEINVIAISDSFKYLVKTKALPFELVEDWIFFWTFFTPISLIINLYSKENMLIYKGLLFIILIFAMTISRRYIVSSFRYLLANAFIIFLAFIISFTLLEKIVFFIPIIICSIISMKKRNSKIIDFYGISMLFWCEVLMVICYFFAFNYHLTNIMSLINFASINVAITCTLYVCISRMESFMEWEGENIKGYAKRLMSMKLSCIAFISTMILFSIFLAKLIKIYRLFDILTNKILVFFRGAPLYKPESITPPKIMTNTLIPFKETPAATSINSVPVISNTAKMLFYTALALLIICLLFVIIKSVKNLYINLTLKKTYKKEKKEFVISMDDIMAKIKNGFKIKFEVPFNLTNQKKIRKLYHKLIKSYKTKGIIPCDFNTPIEIESNVRKNLGKNISEATIIYEKARYSNSECSNSDVAKMKKFLANTLHS